MTIVNKVKRPLALVLAKLKFLFLFTIIIIALLQPHTDGFSPSRIWVSKRSILSPNFEVIENKLSHFVKIGIIRRYAGLYGEQNSSGERDGSTAPAKVVWKSKGNQPTKSTSSERDRDSNNPNSKSYSRRRHLRKVQSFNDVVTQPDNFYRTLSYNYLANNSLRSIETMPHFRFDKGDSYLKKWWFVCKRWGLLTGEFEQFDKQMEVEQMHGENATVPLYELYAACEGKQGRVICIGDVHGCVNEVCDLLRSLEYRPGDLVLFLGDLVAKGPSSIEVVKLAIDLGALSVRGNHDHEVVRQGVTYRRQQGKYRRQSVRNMAVQNHEHLRVALGLNLKEFNWLAQLPYYICSVDLGTLFVHAGFQSYTKLMEQDPWVMMTMRSLLPDGRVSARCIYTQPWADQWPGPMTVLFGHDAARGLQYYDHAVGLDTGCVYGGKLSALILPERRVVDVPARKIYSDYINSRSHKSFLNSGGNKGEDDSRMHVNDNLRSEDEDEDEDEIEDERKG
jgi:hypothetical protein